MLLPKCVEMTDEVSPNFPRMPVFRKIAHPPHKRIRVAYTESPGFTGCTRHCVVHVLGISNKNTQMYKRVRSDVQRFIVPEIRKNTEKVVN